MLDTMRTVIAVVGAVAALGVGGTAYAASSSSSATPAPVSPAAATPTSPTAGRAGAARPKVRSLLQRADHGTLELKVKGQWVTYTFDRGTVESISSTAITVQRPDGQTVTEKIGPGTRYVGVGSESAIQTDHPAMVVSSGGVAVRIRQRPSA